MAPVPLLARPLATVGGGDLADVGGKAAVLGDLMAAGIAVPPGFAVTTAAFRQVMRALDPEGAIPSQIERLAAADEAAIAAVTVRVRGAILAAPLSAQVRQAIGARYRSLAREAGPAADVGVAVRSSATGEDSATASFAGLQDTYLWVQGEESVAGHVRRCWASLYSVESVTYRRHQGLPERGLAMGVVVQAMVDPRCAGVMFTRSPVTGDTSVIVIEASWGLGSALVSGDVTPDSYVVSKVTGEILKRTVGTKLRQHRRDPDRGGVCVRDVPPERRGAPCLDDAEIRALAGLGRRVSEHYDAHQDIEWAVTGGSAAEASGAAGFAGRAAGSAGPAPGSAATQIVVLQSRPETVWARRRATPAAQPTARAYDHVLHRLGVPGHRAAP